MRRSGLENWEVEHALREVISNALDEQVISKTARNSNSKDKQGIGILGILGGDTN